MTVRFSGRAMWATRNAKRCETSHAGPSARPGFVAISRRYGQNLRDRVKIFAPAVSSFKTFQDQDDPKSVVLVLEVTDMEKLEAIMTDPKVQEAKDRHTVVDPILLSMPVTV